MCDFTLEGIFWWGKLYFSITAITDYWCVVTLWNTSDIITLIFQNGQTVSYNSLFLLTGTNFLTHNKQSQEKETHHNGVQSSALYSNIALLSNFDLFQWASV